jgi:subtilase family serine protease
MTCLSLIRGDGRTRIHPDLINPSAYRPVDLQEAYNLVAASADQGKGMTVAVVDGGADPDAGWRTGRPSIVRASVRDVAQGWRVAGMSLAEGVTEAIPVTQDQHD